MADNIVAWIIAGVMLLILLGTGAAAQIMGAFTSTFGWVLGRILGLCIILAIVFAVFNKK